MKRRKRTEALARLPFPTEKDGRFVFFRNHPFMPPVFFVADNEFPKVLINRLELPGSLETA